MTKPRSRRVRVLVDLGSGPNDPLLRAIPAGVYHRGKRLRELAILGLAAEAAGLRVELAGNGAPVLRGDNLALIRLDESPSTGLADPHHATITAPQPQDVVLPAGFVDQFLD